MIKFTETTRPKTAILLADRGCQNQSASPLPVAGGDQLPLEARAAVPVADGAPLRVDALLCEAPQLQVPALAHDQTVQWSEQPHWSARHAASLYQPQRLI